jgi:hypothetical protein
MEGPIILLVLILLWLLIAPIVALVKASDAKDMAREMKSRLDELEKKVKSLTSELRNAKGAPEIVEPPPEATPAGAQEDALRETLERVWQEERRIAAAETIPAVLPPPLPLVRATRESGPAIQESSAEPKEPFSLERFMGVKLFAWLGGVAMFFGVTFFVKYAFDNNLIPPSVRVALGFVTGAGLLVGGLWTHRLPKYRVLAQSFCATGILILYGVSFAAHAIYRFPAFGQIPTFILMALVTLAAFLIAVRLNALVVAVLGMLGGFLTPILLSTGNDKVFALFGYIALLDIGLLAVARHSNWRYLIAAAAAGTALMQVGWFEKYFVSGSYDAGALTLVPMGIQLFFILVFLTSMWIGKRRGEDDDFSSGSAIFLTALAMVFAYVMLGFGKVAERQFLLYGFVLAVNLAAIAIAAMRLKSANVQLAIAVFTFGHLAFWSAGRLTPENLTSALALYLVFGALHAVAPLLLMKRGAKDGAALSFLAAPWFGPVMLLMMALPIIHLPHVPFFLWGAVLVANLLVIGLASATRAAYPMFASLVLTMGVAVLWLFRGPSDAGSLMPFLVVICLFSLLFVAAGRWLSKAQSSDGGQESHEEVVARMLPVVSAVIPFLLLMLAMQHVPVPNPSPVFLVALLMSVLLGGLAVFGKQGALVLAALAGTLAVEAVWYVSHFNAADPNTGLIWYLTFYAIFLAFPFVFRKTFAGEILPWIASALSGVGHFLLIHDLFEKAYPNEVMGLIPAAFAVPSLGALMMVVRMGSPSDEIQRSRMAWFGGVALLFITLVFPIQFDRQWLTVSWAIEGALLIWLFRRVQHPGLQLTGLALLAIAFIRLTLNPAVFTDYPRSGVAILNWHLYAYGLVAAAQFLGAMWFRDPAGRWNELKPRGVMTAFGGILLFLLLNIEIADYFTAPGDRCVAFRFGGNFARDMTYSIAWGLFSLGLLGMGIWRKSKHARFAAIGLLVATLLKVFLHDLAAIENIFRIGALIGVAVIAFIASFLYQRFFERSGPSDPS